MVSTTAMSDDMGVQASGCPTPIKHADVLIVGGGPAGLSTALGLCRKRHTAIVFDSGMYRNEVAHHMHNFPTWDHHNPAALRAAAQIELQSRYSSVTFERSKVVSAHKKAPDGVFVVVDELGQEFLGKRLVLATGQTDIMPDIPGYAACWGQSIYHCLYCHGFENAPARNAGILATQNMGRTADPANHFARLSM